MTTQHLVLTVLGGVAGLIAAGLWFRAATVKIPKLTPEEGRALVEAGYSAAQVSYDGRQVFEEMKVANKWNAWAAAGTGAAVILQTVASFVP